MPKQCEAGVAQSAKWLGYSLHFCHRHSISGSDLPVSESVKNNSVPSRLPHLGGKTVGLKANHSIPSNSELINEWIYTATAKFAFIVCAQTNLFCYFNFIPDNIIVT